MRQALTDAQIARLKKARAEIAEVRREVSIPAQHPDDTKAVRLTLLDLEYSLKWLDAATE